MLEHNECKRKDIAAFVDISLPCLNDSIEQLKSEGLVEELGHNGDSRIKLIGVTDKAVQSKFREFIEVVDSTMSKYGAVFITNRCKLTDKQYNFFKRFAGITALEEYKEVAKTINLFESDEIVHFRILIRKEQEVRQLEGINVRQ